MKARWIVVVALVAVVALALFGGFAHARTRAAGPQPGWWDQMQGMHGSASMQGMHSQMPDDIQAQCDEMHAQMGGMMGGGGMMGS